MQEALSPLRQRLGRRLGPTPYYRIAAATPNRLSLIAQPELNRAAGRQTLALGGLLLAFALVLLVSGAIAAGQGAGPGPIAVTVALGGLFGGLGMQRIVGGRAILSVRNQIDVTPTGMTYTQTSAGLPAQTQHLPAAQISAIRLRRRPLAVGTVFRRVLPIVALEALSGPEVWIIDSATEADALRPTAEGLCVVLGIDIAAQAAEGERTV